jgi:hypothetical protein
VRVGVLVAVAVFVGVAVRVGVLVGVAVLEDRKRNALALQPDGVFG